MNRNNLGVIFFLMLLVACEQPIAREKIFDHILTETLAENPDAIGILAHIEAPNQQLSWSGAAGFSDWGKSEVLDANQPALLASITKTYVAVSIVRLIEQGELRLDQNLVGLLSKRSDSLMQHYNYDMQHIEIQHLLSHKSGLPDYVPTDLFLTRLQNEPQYRWTRDEQIALALKQGPLFEPGTSFVYGDINYLLLGEVLEQATGKAFNHAIAECINYKALGLNHTWFYTLDSMPKNELPLIHQYASAGTEDSYAIDNSFDLYGGGGIASTSKDLAKFISALFDGKVFKNDTSINLLLQDVTVKDGNEHEDYINDVPCEYYMGIQSCPFEDSTVFWHLGYWGTVYKYYPALETTLTIFVVNQKAFPAVERSLTSTILKEFQ